MRAGPMTFAAIGVLAAVLAPSACAIGGTPDAGVTPRTRVDDPALATLPNVRVTRDVAYRSDAGIPQTLDVCTPPTAARAKDPGLFAAIVEVHGGSWARGDKADLGWRAICQWLASSGYVVFNLDYRFAPEHPFPAGFDDLRAAVEWIREPAQVTRWDLDPDRVGAFGGSAGGNLVSLLGTTGRGGWTTGSRVAAVVEMSGPADLTGRDVNPDFVPDQLAYLHCTSEGDCPDARRASPVFQVDPTDPPFFITHSTDETRIPIAQSEAFAARLRRAGGDTTFVVVQGRAHSIAAMSDDLKTRIAAFYRRTLGPAARVE
ncbi:alpha/beta hydrolase [Pseudolysinimonas sp.]|uniref:alpha/beta hydrolase n=1 Tax=Pseudolysinimonas sp. TaxID=2680009 RepID=UPI003F821E09